MIVAALLLMAVGACINVVSVEDIRGGLQFTTEDRVALAVNRPNKWNQDNVWKALITEIYRTIVLGLCVTKEETGVSFSTDQLKGNPRIFVEYSSGRISYGLRLMKSYGLVRYDPENRGRWFVPNTVVRGMKIYCAGGYEPTQAVIDVFAEDLGMPLIDEDVPFELPGEGFIYCWNCDQHVIVYAADVIRAVACGDPLPCMQCDNLLYTELFKGQVDDNDEVMD